MVTLTVQACRRPDGGRQGRNGTFIEVYGPQYFQAAENSPGPKLNAPSTFGPYSFAFWSIVGAAGGNYATLANPAPYSVGTSDIVARAWYVVTGAKPKPGFKSGMYVDAFDIDTGLFFDDGFVGVKNADFNSNLLLWFEANTNGFVPTGEIEYVDATTPVGSHGFERWECVEGKKEPIGGTLLTGSQGSNSQAVAFYRRVFVFEPRPHRDPFGGEIVAPLAGTWVSWGVKVDGGGPTGGGPVGPGPMMEIAAGVALAEAADTVDKSLRPDVLKIASKQVSLASDRLQKAIDAAAKTKAERR